MIHGLYPSLYRHHLRGIELGLFLFQHSDVDR